MGWLAIVIIAYLPICYKIHKHMVYWLKKLKTKGRKERTILKTWRYLRLSQLKDI